MKDDLTMKGHGISRHQGLCVEIRGSRHEHLFDLAKHLSCQHCSTLSQPMWKESPQEVRLYTCMDDYFSRNAGHSSYTRR